MILDDILEHKKIEIADAKKLLPINILKDYIETSSKPRDFYKSLYSTNKDIRIIAEIKKASPSKGLLREKFDPVELSEIYSDSGASAISVLTDNKYFNGSLDDLLKVRSTVELPLLRKDFIIDPYQVYEARYYGADAVLLIVAALEIVQLKELKELVESLGLYPLVEVHNERELQTALDLDCTIIGINNRDLKTFNVDLNTAIRLSSLIPEDKLVISESGISTPDDIRLLYEYGIKVFLIGEILIKSQHIADLLYSFLNFNK
jgi:indole-3-glycerol phosphate synthase